VSIGTEHVTGFVCLLVGLNSVLAGMEYVSICKNHALCDNFFKLCMVLGMDMTFSKTTTHKLGETPGGRYAQNDRWMKQIRDD